MKKVLYEIVNIVIFIFFSVTVVASIPLVFVCGALIGGCGAVEKTFALWWRTLMYNIGMYDDVE